jgi:uncharacterized membrane protein YfcA
MEFIEFLLVGLVAGSWGSLIGAGGGFIIVPLLLLFSKDMSVAEVSAVSLFSVVGNGISGTVAYIRLKRIDYRSGLIFLLATLPGAVVGAYIVNFVDRSIFQLVFGAMLSLVAAYILTRRKRREVLRPGNRSVRRVVDSQGNAYEYTVRMRLGTVLTFAVGYFAGMLGVGGGVMNVPAFVLLLGIPIQVATATSQFMVMGTSLVATITNYLQGDLSSLGVKAFGLVLGTVIGGQFGARASSRITSEWLTRVLALALMLTGVRLLISGISGG